MGRTVGRTAAEGHVQTTANYGSEKIEKNRRSMMSEIETGHKNKPDSRSFLYGVTNRKLFPEPGDPRWVARVSCAPESRVGRGECGDADPKGVSFGWDGFPFIREADPTAPPWVALPAGRPCRRDQSRSTNSDPKA